MLTQDDLQQIAKIFNQKLDTVEKRLSDKIGTVEERLNDKIGVVEAQLNQRIDTVDAKIEAVLEFNKKTHLEIMEHLVESNESNGKQLKEHEIRLDQLEEHTGLTKPHKN